MCQLLSCDIFSELNTHQEAPQPSWRGWQELHLAAMDQCLLHDGIDRPCSALERELAELVAARQVQACIDSHAKVLYARLADPRSATFANALRISAS